MELFNLANIVFRTWAQGGDAEMVCAGYLAESGAGDTADTCSVYLISSGLSGLSCGKGDRMWWYG